ncbi:Uncharacterized conserved protein [Citrobacter koseri]|nr:Uncharacterized conserved protein [Citrobacter koseri]
MTGGRLCPDGQWRYIITMEDAIAGGFNLASIEKLRNRYKPRHLQHALYVRVRGQQDSVFSFSHVERCCVDPATWEDHDENLPPAVR